MKRLLPIIGLLWCWLASAAEVIPPAPARHFNDYANVTSGATAAQLDKELEDFERATSSQLLVAIYPKMETESDIADYTVRVYRAWKVGLKGKDNGAVLFVFVQDHKLRIATGYGLEGALPDALCKRIIDDEITPRLRQGDFNGGLTAGVHAMMAATKGEYKGTGSLANQVSRKARSFAGNYWFIMLVVIFILIFNARSRRAGYRGGWTYGGGGFGGWGEGGGGGGWSGGGGGGGDSGFSGGGGSTGGGGASGSW